MTERVTLRPDGARILVSRASDAPGALRPVDRTEPEGRALVGVEEVCFVVVDTDSADRAALVGVGVGPQQVALVALVASSDVAGRLRDEGWAEPVVIEVALDEHAVARLAVLRRAGELVGVVVSPDPPTANDIAPFDPLPGIGPVGIADLDAQAEAGRARGRTIGLLTSVMLAGVATVRTDDPVTARRVRSVVAALTEADHDDVRMEP